MYSNFKVFIIQLQILLCFMFCHESDIDMTLHVPIVLSLGIITHNLLGILSEPGSSLRQFNQISTFSLSNTSSDKGAKNKIVSSLIKSQSSAKATLKAF